jgi:hypothetical protein
VNREGLVVMLGPLLHADDGELSQIGTNAIIDLHLHLDHCFLNISNVRGRGISDRFKKETMRLEG